MQFRKIGNVRYLPFTRKLTDDELGEIIDNWEYDPNRYDNDVEDYEPHPFYDEYGNPSVEHLDAIYEGQHGIGSEPMTLEELFAEWRQLYEETREEREKACAKFEKQELLNAI